MSQVDTYREKHCIESFKPNQEIIMDPKESIKRKPDDAIVNKLPKPTLKSPFKKPDSVRNVHLARMFLNYNHPIPYCFRRKCRNAGYFSRQTCRNTKCNTYSDSDSSISDSTDLSYISSSTSSETVKSVGRVNTSNSCNFSSDSDDIDALIKKTRERMKKQRLSTETQEGSAYTPSICSDDRILDIDGIKTHCSLHSMETIVLQPDFNRIPYSPTMSPGLIDDFTDSPPRCKISVSPDLLLNKVPKTENINKFENVTRQTSENSDFSSLQEISEKCAMEHYLNCNLH